MFKAKGWFEQGPVVTNPKIGDYGFAEAALDYVHYHGKTKHDTTGKEYIATMYFEKDFSGPRVFYVISWNSEAKSNQKPRTSAKPKTTTKAKASGGLKVVTTDGKLSKPKVVK